ncbi:MAG: peptidylprolyl isomerase [bacterium]
MNARHHRIALMAIAALTLFGCAKKQTGDVIADVGGRKISAGQLLITYDRITPPNRPPFETLEQKKAFLETTILKEILMGEADARGITKSAEVEGGVKRLRETELLKRMFIEKGQKPVELTPQELEDYYKASQEQVRLRNIWISGPKEKADAVLAQIRAGADFEEMARKHGENEYAAKGGDMGWKAIADPTLDFFSQQMKTMKPGDISDPIPIMGGHHIVQMADRKEADMAEFESKKIPVRQSLRQKKEAAAWKSYLAEVQTKNSLKTVPDNVRMVKERFATVARGEIPQFSDSEKALPLVAGTSVNWTITDFLYFLTSLGQQFRPDFANPDFDPTTWLLTRATNQLVLKEAEALGFEKASDFQEAIQRERERLSLDAVHAALVSNIVVTEDEKRAFYQAKQESLLTPATARVRYIFTVQQARIDSAYAEIVAGKPFVDVVRRYSEDKNTSEKGGVVDSLPQGIFNDPNMDNAIFLLAPNEYTRPIAYNQAFYIFQMIETRPGVPMTYEQAEKKISEFLKTQRETDTFDKWINEKRTSLNIKIYDEALNAIVAEEAGAS